MTILYKLTNEKYQTYGATQWGPGITHRVSGDGDLCGPGWIHAYTHPLLAVLLNPIHAGFGNPILWLGDGDVGKMDYGLKVGCTRFTTIKVVSLPQIFVEQKVCFGILCALVVCFDPAFVDWANKWLTGEDRSEAAARAAEAAKNNLDLIAIALRAVKV